MDRCSFAWEETKIEPSKAECYRSALDFKHTDLVKPHGYAARRRPRARLAVAPKAEINDTESARDRASARHHPRSVVQA